MYAYVVYRIALSLHMEIFLGLWIAILNRSLNINLVVFVGKKRSSLFSMGILLIITAIFADIATLAIAYDNAPYSPTPVKWNLPKLWGMSVLLGVVLAVGSWIALTTMYAGGHDGGIVQNFGNIDAVLFLEISLTENWLIFITRANGPFWSSIPSWQLSGAILVVDILATLFCIFGWFVHGQTSIVAVVRIWIFSFGIFCIMGGLYYFMQGSSGFDNLMHGKSPKQSQKQRSLEDFGKLHPIHVAYRSITDISCSCLSPASFHPTREDAVNKRCYIPRRPLAGLFYFTLSKFALYGSYLSTTLGVDEEEAFHTPRNCLLDI